MGARHCKMLLEAPMMSFGGPAVDHVRPTMAFPGASMLAGLLGNAMGWDWSMRQELQSIQDRLVYGCAIARKGEALVDNQNAKLSLADEGWTTRGQPEGRAGAPSTYECHHRMSKHYHADQSVRVVFRTDNPNETTALAVFLKHPMRPLYIGRKNCLPTCRVFAGVVEADTVHEALVEWCLLQDGAPAHAVGMWPDGEGPSPTKHDEHYSFMDSPDVKNWRTGLHGGSRRVCVGPLNLGPL